jgi:hypothetical protein
MTIGTQISPRRYGIVCGVLYLYIFVAGNFAALFVRGRLIVTENAATTASNIVANEFLFRLGFSGQLLHLVGDVAIAMILYALFRPADRNIALLAAFMRLSSDLILAIASLSHFAALRFLGSADSLQAFSLSQRHSLASLVMRLHEDAYAISLLFFAFACLALGYVIFRSGYFPRAIRGMLAFAGASYLVWSLTRFLHPALGARMFNAGIFAPCFIAELSLAVWLIVRGVDAARWEECACAQASQSPSATRFPG